MLPKCANCSFNIVKWLNHRLSKHLCRLIDTLRQTQDWMMKYLNRCLLLQCWILIWCS